MAATGIGFAGIDGAWWLPAVEPFPLPAAALDELPRIGRALFALFDAIAELLDTSDELRALLTHRVPSHLPWLAGRESVLMLRPDFQLVAEGRDVRLVATELEICPAAQGFATAMQTGYRLATDLADGLAALLGNRPLLFTGSAQWSEFLFEQLAFCRALAERGVAAYVLYDRPIADIAAEVRAGQRWVPPMFGVRERTPDWDEDVLGRIRSHGLYDHLWPDKQWPGQIGDTVVFRFGYFDCFAPETIGSFVDWQAAGATFLNPPITWLENKAVLAAASLPAVRARLSAWPGVQETLDRCLPETRLLTAEAIPALADERTDWIIKYAGFDGANRAWGGRSVRFGRDCTRDEWLSLLREGTALPWPVVAQRLAPSLPVRVAYYDDRDTVRSLSGHTRLRSFLWRDGHGETHAGGNHVTVSAAAQVSEATDAVQAPVVRNENDPRFHAGPADESEKTVSSVVPSTSQERRHV